MKKKLIDFGLLGLLGVGVMAIALFTGCSSGNGSDDRENGSQPPGDVDGDPPGEGPGTDPGDEPTEPPPED